MIRTALSLALAASVSGALPAAFRGGLPGARPAGSPPEVLSPRAARWWSDIKAIANNSTEGRLTGSRGYLRAAHVVMARFKEEGLKPAGENGYLQPVAFESQVVDQGASTASLTGPGGTTVLRVGSDMLIAAGGGPRPATVEAPLVFIGYGLHLPDQGHDDLKGLDLKGKIAVVISGGPADISGPIKADARNGRAKALAAAGAIGLISITTPKQVEIPWARLKLLSSQPGMYLDDALFRDSSHPMFAGSIDADKAEAVFKGSGHSFAELAALADASKAMPTFALPLTFKATVSAKRAKLTSPNLVAKLEGSDPKLRNEYIVVSAHLDHLGIGAAIGGDRIYNGAMDDASGVACVLDIAHALKTGARPKRSVLFVIVTAEEKGLLGSHYYAERPTVPKDAIIADFNFDMPLPLWPLKDVLVQGDHESTLGDDARAVGAARGLTLIADPLPDRNSFTRTDQYSFVKAGVPALAFKFGFPKGTPAFDIEHDWRANRYHSPSDDLDQPGVMKEEVLKLDDYVAALAVQVANETARPHWLETSVFKRYAK